MEQGNYEFQGILYGYVESREAFLDTIRDLERNGIWIQPFPSWAVVDEKLVEYAAFLAIKDFQKEAEIARKVNAQILLRYAGVDQIREAITKFGIEDHQPVLLVLITDGGIHKSEITAILKQKDTIKLKQKEHLRIEANIEKLKSSYDLQDKYFKAIKEGRGISRKKAFFLALMEQMAVMIVK